MTIKVYGKSIVTVSQEVELDEDELREEFIERTGWSEEDDEVFDEVGFNDFCKERAMEECDEFMDFTFYADGNMGLEDGLIEDPGMIDWYGTEEFE